MLTHPRIGQRVQCWYRNRRMPHHGKTGRVVVRGLGKPRNHGVLIEGRLVVVPCGNLRKLAQ